jgi:hypothetical protein
VGEDRAETYLRLAAEAWLGRAGRSFRDVRASVEQVRWAGGVLVAAGALAGGSGWEVGWLRLTPALRGCADAIEVVVTGPATRVRAVVPVREGSAMADT